MKIKTEKERRKIKNQMKIINPKHRGEEESEGANDFFTCCQNPERNGKS
jgi:hypothetical protein